jgi:hypothetical protein
MIEFARGGREVVGTGHHRSGWPFVVSHLQKLKSIQIDRQILFDDFVERSFSYDVIKDPYLEDWGGIFHHPPFMPDFAVKEDTWECIFNSDMFRFSSGNLIFAIFTTEHQEKEFARIFPNIPTLVALHPTQTRVPMWSPDAYMLSNPMKIIQVGSYLRDTRAIYRVPSIEGFSKTRLFPAVKWLRKFDREINDRHSAEGIKYHYPVISVRHVNDHEYDWMLSNSVILTVPLNASACNVVVECIARCTPLIVPRLDSVVEYLGEDYPLYIENETLQSKERMNQILSHTVFDAFDYLKGMDKTFLGVEQYVDSIAGFVSGIASNSRKF